MKKLSVLISFVLFGVCSIHSQDRAFVSFMCNSVKSIGSYFNRSAASRECDLEKRSYRAPVSFMCNSVKSIGSYFNTSADSRECYLEKLPLEIHSIIVTNFFNLVVGEKFVNQEKIQKIISDKPLLGYMLIDKFVQMQKMCKSSIGGKYFLAEELFFLPKKERDVFIRMRNRSFLEDGNIDSADYAIIFNMTQENIKKGLDLEVDVKRRLYKKSAAVEKIGRAVIMIGTAVGLMGFFVPESFTILKNSCIVLSIMCPCGIVLHIAGLCMSGDHNVGTKSIKL